MIFPPRRRLHSRADIDSHRCDDPHGLCDVVGVETAGENDRRPRGVTALLTGLGDGVPVRKPTGAAPLSRFGGVEENIIRSRVATDRQKRIQRPKRLLIDDRMGEKGLEPSLW
jgi:hypothetical protein